MANPKDALVIEKIKSIRCFSKEVTKLRKCYQFIKDEPRKTNQIIQHMQKTEKNATTLGEGRIDLNETPNQSEIKFTLTMQMLKIYFDNKKEATTIEGMKYLIQEMVLAMEGIMRKERDAIAQMIVSKLEPSGYPGSEIGFVRKVLDIEIPIRRKADEVIEIVVKATLRELIGDTEDIFFAPDCSAIIDLEDVNAKISPILREYLKCKSIAEANCFLETHKELLQSKYLRELYEQSHRYFLKGLCQEAKGLSVLYDVLRKSKSLKELAADYFRRKTIEPWSKGAQLFYKEFEANSVEIRENYISNFKYKFQAIPSFEFVSVVPNETEKNFPLFMSLPEQLRKSLIEGSFTAVDEAFQGMSPDVLKTSLTMCAIGGFFYFKSAVKSTDFGIMYKALNKAIEKL